MHRNPFTSSSTFDHPLLDLFAARRNVESMLGIYDWVMARRMRAPRCLELSLLSFTIDSGAF
jgi:hypothetical protein